ncbi:MAG: hypothetical protein E6K62_06485 [Nitrospirae bacterium]|nr:MAG: hypothetical protein E6K62_06485 [Nitrospirota bacterium]
MINGSDFLNSQRTPPHSCRRARRPKTSRARVSGGARPHLDLNCMNSRIQIGRHEIEVMGGHRLQDKIDHLIGHRAVGGDIDNPSHEVHCTTLDHAAKSRAQSLGPMVIHYYGRKSARTGTLVERLTIDEDPDLQRRARTRRTGRPVLPRHLGLGKERGFKRSPNEQILLVRGFDHGAQHRFEGGVVGSGRRRRRGNQYQI